MSDAPAPGSMAAELIRFAAWLAARNYSPYTIEQRNTAIGAFIAWAEVRYAGTVRFNNRGVIQSWDNMSGHYQAPSSYADRAGLPTDVFQPYRRR